MHVDPDSRPAFANTIEIETISRLLHRECQHIARSLIQPASSQPKAPFPDLQLSFVQHLYGSLFLRVSATVYRSNAGDTLLSPAKRKENEPSASVLVAALRFAFLSTKCTYVLVVRIRLARLSSDIQLLVQSCRSFKERTPSLILLCAQSAFVTCPKEVAFSERCIPAFAVLCASARVAFQQHQQQQRASAAMSEWWGTIGKPFADVRGSHSLSHLRANADEGLLA